MTVFMNVERSKAQLQAACRCDAWMTDCAAAFLPIVRCAFSAAAQVFVAMSCLNSVHKYIYIYIYVVFVISAFCCCG